MFRIALLLLLSASVVGQTTTDGKKLPTPPKSDNMLFYLQRSKNTNTVVYETHKDSKGVLSIETPVHPYWINYEEEGNKKSDLSTFERKAVYGIDIEAIKDRKDAYVMKLKAFNKRSITVVKDKLGHYVGQITINGKKAILKRIFIEAKEGLLTPTVLHVDLFGIDPISGASVTERIFP
jgi:hypothetical protein